MRTIITRSGVPLIDLAKDIADQLVLTTWWEKIVDQSASEGKVIISPIQTWQYRTATANQIDNGVNYLANGKTYRYEQPSALGEEKFYLKLLPFYDATTNWKGYQFQGSNALNATNDDVVYDNNGIGGAENTKCKDASGNYIAHSAFTGNYPHRTQTTARCVSPTNTNYSYYAGINPFNTFVNKTTSLVSYRLFVYHTVDVANPQNREDFVLGVCWGEDIAIGYVRTFSFGVPKTLVDWYGQNFGASRGGFASDDCNCCIGNCGGFKTLSSFSSTPPSMPGTSEWNQATMNNFSQSFSSVQLCLSNIDNAGGQKLFTSQPNYFGQNTFGYTTNGTSYRKKSLDLRNMADKDIMCTSNHYLMPITTYYYVYGNTSTGVVNYPTDPIAIGVVNYPTDPIAILPFSGEVYSIYPESIRTRFGGSCRTGDLVEYNGKRYFLVYGSGAPFGTSSVSNATLIYLEDI